MNLCTSSFVVLVLCVCVLGESLQHGVKPYRTYRDVCEQDPKVGRCRASFPKYFYNKTSGECEKFIYGGCDGNGNRFSVKSQCEDACKKTEKRESPCSQPMEQGRCRGSFRRYFYDEKSSQCKPFIYGGCGKNQNNFRTMADCEQKCSVKPRSALRKTDEGLNDVKVEVKFSLNRLPESDALLFMHKDISMEDEYILGAVTSEGDVMIELKNNGFVSKAFVKLHPTNGKHQISVKAKDNSTELAIVDGIRIEMQKVEEHLPRFFWESQAHGSNWNERYNRGYDLLYIGGVWACDPRASEFIEFEGCIDHVSSSGLYPVALHFGYENLKKSKSCSKEMTMSVTVPNEIDNIAKISSCDCSPKHVRMIPFNLKNGKKLTHYKFEDDLCIKSNVAYYKKLHSSTNGMIIIGLSLMVSLLVILAYIKRKQAETMTLSLIAHALMQQKQESEEEDNPPSYEDPTFHRLPSYDPPPAYEELAQAQSAISVTIDQTTKEQIPTSYGSEEETKPLKNSSQ